MRRGDTEILYIDTRKMGERGFMRKKNEAMMNEENEMLLELTKKYLLVCKVNAKDNSFQVIRMNRELKSLVNCFGKMTSLLITFAQAHVDVAWREKFRKFADVQRIYQNFLRGVKEEEELFVNNRGEWVKIRVIPVPDFSEDNPCGILAFENVTWEMREKDDPIRYQLSLSRSYAFVATVDLDRQSYEILEMSADMIDVPAKGETRVLREAIRKCLSAENEGSFDKIYENADHPERGYVEEEFVLEDAHGEPHFYAVYCTQVNDGLKSSYVMFARNTDELNAKRVVLTKNKEQKMIALIEEQNEALKVALDTAEAASKAKSVFLSNMSHDIRTPMNAITGMTNIAKQNIHDPEKVNDCLNKITTASNHLLSLINNILDMSKIENGITTLNEDKFAFSELMGNIQDIVQPQLKAKNLTMRVSLKGVEHDRVIGDTLRLRQAFINIIGNSIKFTPTGGRILVRIKELQENHAGYATFCCTFADNGIGMKPEFIDKIFEPFEREKNMTLSKVEGTGLGMAITKNIVEMMNGHIKVKSEEGKGTTFKIVLHLKMQEDDFADGTTNNNVELSDFANVDYSHYRMLLVEDNELNMEIAEDIIGMTGIQIEKAWDGTEAVEKVRNSPEGYYDIILCDIQMPVMNGYIATTKIRELGRLDVKRMPIVAMTANAFAEDKQKALDVGMNEHISKPIDIQNLFEVLHKFLN